MSKQIPDDSGYLGQHTTLSHVASQPRLWRRIPYLRENEGHAPPNILAVGDRRRVYAIARRLENSVLLPETAARLSGGPMGNSKMSSTIEFGRVAMAVGLASSSVPVLVVETQMGAPATQIIMKEVLSDKLTSTDYRVGRARISPPHKIVIRIGTAGGINCEGKPEIKVGDIVNATHSIGATGAVIQSLTQLDFWRPGAAKEFKRRWASLGSEFTLTNDGHPRVECSGDVVEALDVAGRRLAKYAYKRGGNITKDSLYTELGREIFLELCRTQNCRSTEMELSAIALSARESRAHFGMISAIVGVLPGASFGGPRRVKAAAEQRALRVGLGATRYLASSG